MTGALRPPPGTSAPAFFESWLPEAFAALPVSAWNARTVRVTLSGAGGGDWWLCLDQDGLAVTPAPPGGRTAPPDLWVRQSTADFLSIFDPGPDLPALLSEHQSLFDLLVVAERDAEILGAVSGRIMIEIAGRRRRRFAVDLAFGRTGVAAGRPRATIRLDAAAYTSLLSGAVAPLQALIQGGIKIEGDRALATQVLLLGATWRPR